MRIKNIKVYKIKEITNVPFMDKKRYSLKSSIAMIMFYTK